MVATDADIPLLPVEPEGDIISAITPNPNQGPLHNIALRVIVNSSINTATIQVHFNTELAFHSFIHGDITPQRAHTMVQQSGQYVTLTILNTDNFLSGTHLVTLYFYSQTNVSNPVSPLTQQVPDITTDNNSTLSNPFTYIQAMLGDVTGDNITDSSDQLSILRYVVDKETYNATQLLAGDVDFDGSVGSSDSLMVGNYIVSKKLSFLDIERIYHPLGTVNGLNRYLTYRIKNVQSNNYIKADSQNNAILGAANTILSTEFSIVLADTTSPIYRLVSRSNSLDLRLKNNHTLTFDETQAVTNSQYWYIIPKGTKYFLINISAPLKTLGNCGSVAATANGGVSYLDYGNSWEIIPMIRVKAFYDLAYLARKGNIAVSELHGIQNEIGNIVSTAFGIEVAIPSPYAMVSHADTCHGNNLTSLTLTQANAACGRSPNDTAPCENYTNTENAPSSNVHHKNSRAVLYYFKTSSYNNAYRYELLYSGHKACGKNQTTNKHVVDVVAGVGYSATPGVGEVFYIGSDVEYRLRITALHELSHMLGATGGDVDTEHYSKRCIMSKGSNRDNAYLLDLWEDSQNTELDQAVRTDASNALFCSDCRNLIATHLQLL